MIKNLLCNFQKFFVHIKKKCIHSFFNKLDDALYHLQLAFLYFLLIDFGHSSDFINIDKTTLVTC